MFRRVPGERDSDEVGPRKAALVAIGMGGNVAPRRERLREAAAGLASLLQAARFSPVYETDPVGPVDQPRFLNACCVGRTGLEPRALLTRMKDLERAAGRRRTAERYGPRELDLDILLYGGEVVETRGLVIPHPRLAERAFALVPLADLAPGWSHPVLGRTVSELLEAVGSDGVDATRIELLPGEGDDR